MSEPASGAQPQSQALCKNQAASEPGWPIRTETSLSFQEWWWVRLSGCLQKTDKPVGNFRWFVFPFLHFVWLLTVPKGTNSHWIDWKIYSLLSGSVPTCPGWNDWKWEAWACHPTEVNFKGLPSLWQHWRTR